VKTVELYIEEQLILVVKQRKTNHDYTTKGKDHYLKVYLVSYNSKELNHRELSELILPEEGKK